MRKRVLVASGVGAFVMAATLWAPALAGGPDAIPGRGARGRPKGVLPHGRRVDEGVGSRAREKEGGSRGAGLRSQQAASDEPARRPRGAIPTCAAITSPPRIRPCSAPATSRSRCTRRTRRSAHSRLRPTPTRMPIRRLFTTTGKSSGWRRGRVRFDRTCAPPWSSARRRGRFLH